MVVGGSGSPGPVAVPGPVAGIQTVPVPGPVPAVDIHIVVAGSPVMVAVVVGAVVVGAEVVAAANTSGVYTGISSHLRTCCGCLLYQSFC